LIREEEAARGVYCEGEYEKREAAIREGAGCTKE